MSAPIRVVLADDQAVVRGGLRMILEAHDDIEVIGEAPDGRAALDLVRSLAPDVVLMDVRMPELDGIEATRRVAQTGAATRVLVLTTYGMDEYVYDALKAGAAGFMVKTDSPERLVDAVRVVAGGEPC
jgi:DNA-binding NarL/FixJ family response regulator